MWKSSGGQFSIWFKNCTDIGDLANILNNQWYDESIQLVKDLITEDQ